jgi:predicted permease
VRVAIRQLARRPAFTIAVVVSLGLGIGANAAMFALLNALLLRPIGVPDPATLVRISSLDDSGNDRGLSPALVDALALDPVLEGTCAVLTPLSVLDANGAVAPRPAHAVSGGCLDALGVRPALGRLLAPADDAVGAEPVAMLTHRMWLRDFGGRRDAIGRTVAIDGWTASIVGVTDEAFSGVLLGFRPDVIYPLTRVRERARAARPDTEIAAHVLGRLEPGVSREQAAERIRAAWPAALRASLPLDRDLDARSEYLRRRLDVTSAETGLDFSLRRRFADPLIVLLCLSGIVLLTACVNAANLLLARNLEKRRQIALRLALGATRGRIVREELAESVALLGLGLGGGYVAAASGTLGIVALLHSAYPGLQLEVAPDARVFWFAAGTAALVLMAFGAWPAWRAGSVDPRGAVVADARVSQRRGWAANALVTIQIALAFGLIAGAAVCALTMGALRGDRAGFDPDTVVSVQLMPRSTTSEASPPDHAYYRTLLGLAADETGRTTLALSSRAPFFGAAPMTTVNGLDTPERTTRAEVIAVSGSFHRLLGAPIVAGRPLQDRDGAGQPGVAVISESVATALFGSRGAVGRYVRVGTGARAMSFEVVGIARDTVVGPARERNLRVVYTSFWQATAPASPVLLVDAGGDPGRTLSRLGQAIAALGREYPARARTLGAERDAALMQEYLLAALSSGFAGIGLAVASVGVYGIIAVAVATRRREIAIRQALGAGRFDVLRTVLGWAAVLIGSGLALGLPLVWVATRGLASLLPPARRPLVVAVLIGGAVLVLAGGLAAWLPARKTASAEPGDTLRGL